MSAELSELWAPTTNQVPTKTLSAWQANCCQETEIFLSPGFLKWLRSSIQLHLASIESRFGRRVSVQAQMVAGFTCLTMTRQWRNHFTHRRRWCHLKSIENQSSTQLRYSNHNAGVEFRSFLSLPSAPSPCLRQLFVLCLVRQRRSITSTDQSDNDTRVFPSIRLTQRNWSCKPAYNFSKLDK